MHIFDPAKKIAPLVFGGLALAICAPAATVTAGPMTFAQFTEQATGSGVENIRFASNAASGYGTAATLSTADAAGNPVYFSYTGIGGDPLPPGLTGPQDALLMLGPSNAGQTTGMPGGRYFNPALPFLGTTTYQPFDGTFRFSFIRTSDFIQDGTNYGNNLLTVTIGPKVDPDTMATVYPVTTASGTNSHSASLNFDDNSYVVTFTSSFLQFGSVVSLGGALAFSGLVSSPTTGFFFNPSISGGARSFVENFLADLTGTFASDPVPTSIITPPTGSVPMPEPQALALFLLGLASFGLLRRRGG
jgi:hypothetical protein